MPIIPTTWEVENGRITARDWLGSKCKIFSKNKLTKQKVLEV
jgi:hypothetical protein